MFQQTLAADTNTERIQAWFKNGRKMLQTYVRSGEIQGKFVLFYATGGLLLEGEWDDGRPDGLTRVYHPNGRIKQEIQFEKGRFHGKWREWDEIGRPLVEAMFREGKQLFWNDDLELPAALSAIRRGIFQGERRS